MADTYLTLRPTGHGLDGIVQTLYGGSITFTSIWVGNGVPTDPDNVEEMVNPLHEIRIRTMTKGENEVILTGYTTTEDVTSGFYANEIGVYAEDENENEYLFAYSYNATDVDYYPDASSGRTQELTLTVVVAVGAAENVDAILVEGDAYAKKEDFEAHIGDYTNPHQVTKTQVGLGNVDNVAVQDMAPTFTQAATRENIVSGEKLPVLFGKIAKVIADFISHLSANNPHGITASGIGAAPSSHNHSAANINSGTLGVVRGGTGKASVTSGAMLKGNGTGALNEVSGVGALFAQTRNNPVFGTLPIALGGTGATDKYAACNNLGALWDYMSSSHEGARDYGRMLSDGFLIQWGDCSAPSGNSDAYEVTFPLAYQNVNAYVVMATVEGVNSSADITIRVQRTARDKFMARCFNNGSPTHTIGASYLAIGLWK